MGSVGRGTQIVTFSKNITCAKDFTLSSNAPSHQRSNTPKQDLHLSLLDSNAPCPPSTMLHLFHLGYWAPIGPSLGQCNTSAFPGHAHSYTQTEHFIVYNKGSAEELFNRGLTYNIICSKTLSIVQIITFHSLRYTLVVYKNFFLLSR